MLFPYIYVTHELEKLQQYIDFIFYEVWCKAPKHKSYGIQLFESNKELFKIMDYLYRRDLAEESKKNQKQMKKANKISSARDFYQSVNEIFLLFCELSEAEIEKYKSYYSVNNNIEYLCLGIPEYEPITYDQLKKNSYNKLNNELERFFKGLYECSFLTLKPLNNIGSFTNYYKKFVESNNEGVCPFCGLQPMDGINVNTREAFDHYLPKSKYPFNSINLKNLVPCCTKCNSSYKKDKDPLLDNQHSRRKVFYPFAINNYRLNVSITFKPNFNFSQLKNLQAEDITINFNLKDKEQEIEVWKELYGIDERYKDRLCQKNKGIYWAMQLLDENQNIKKDIKKVLETLEKNVSIAPWAEDNFLKLAFYEGCEKSRLF